MEVSLKENMRCLTFILPQIKIKIRLNFRAFREIKMITSKLIVMISKILELNCKKLIKTTINTIFKAILDRDRIHIMEIQISNNTAINITIQETI
jgi:hypothetical protein